jgi:orotate phosphoribosyltransferase
MRRNIDSLDEFSRLLVKTGCLRFGTFKLSSGALSSYYVDLRLVPSDPEAFRKVIGYYSEMLQGDLLERSQSLAGTPTAGIAYGSVLAFNHRKPFLCVRREEKEHGTGRRIDGLLFPGVRVLVLDDVVTTGSSLISTIEAIRANGGVVKDAVALLDRDQGGPANLENVVVKLHSFATISQVCGILLDKGVIDESDYDQIIDQIGNQSTES